MTNPEADPADDDHQSTGKEVAPDVERDFPLKDQDKSRTRVALILIEERCKSIKEINSVDMTCDFGSTLIWWSGCLISC